MTGIVLVPPQSESIELEETTATGAATGVPLSHLSPNLHGFRKCFAPGHLAPKFPTATTALKRLRIALVPFDVRPSSGSHRKGWVELFANGWNQWTSPRDGRSRCWNGDYHLYLVQSKLPWFLFVLFSDRHARYVGRMVGRQYSPPGKFSKFGSLRWEIPSVQNGEMLPFIRSRSSQTVGRLYSPPVLRWLGYHGGIS